jgi:2-phospho-L-lactate guanylyltransferase
MQTTAGTGPGSDAVRPTRATALVPLRAGGKSRLAGTLDAEVRQRLLLAMLDDVVAALRAGGVDDVRLLAGDPAAVAAASARDLAVLPDPGPGGDLRGAVDTGLAAVGSDRVRLVVAADLPGLRGPDVAALVAAADRVTVLPTQDGGTAVLLLPVGVTLPSRHGPDSAAAHVAAARAAGLEPRVLTASTAGVDVDGPEDLARLDATAVGPSTAATLRATAGGPRA